MDSPPREKSCSLCLSLVAGTGGCVARENPGVCLLTHFRFKDDFQRIVFNPSGHQEILITVYIVKSHTSI